jgi:hypothetical protein
VEKVEGAGVVKQDVEEVVGVVVEHDVDDLARLGVKGVVEQVVRRVVG